MSTRSTINIQNKDGTIDGIYCHYDGYPDNNGNTLLQNYNSEERARELINLGNISFLGPTTEQNDTKSYHRDDPDEDPLEVNVYPNEKSIDGQDYNYLWKDEMWMMSEWNKNEWVPLDQIVMEAKKEKFYPRIDEEYSADYLIIQAEDTVPTRMKKSFRDVVRDIQRIMQRETTATGETMFTEVQIEDYLKHLIEEIVAF